MVFPFKYHFCFISAELTIAKIYRCSSLTSFKPQIANLQGIIFGIWHRDRVGNSSQEKGLGALKHPKKMVMAKNKLLKHQWRWRKTMEILSCLTKAARTIPSREFSSEIWWKVKGNNDGSKEKYWGQHGLSPSKLVLSQVTKGWMSPCKCTFHLVVIYSPSTFHGLSPLWIPITSRRRLRRTVGHIILYATLFQSTPSSTFDQTWPEKLATHPSSPHPIFVCSTGLLGLKQGGEKLPLVLSPVLAFLTSYLYLITFLAFFGGP